MSYAITAALTLVVGLALWYVQKEKLSLVYTIVESESFPQENGVGKYFVIKINNNGNKLLRNTKINIDFNGSKIEYLKVTQDDLLTEKTATETGFNALIPLFNPKESLKITITVYGLIDITTPEILIRGEGVTAKIINEDASSNMFNWIFLILISCAVGIISVASANYFDTNKQLSQLKIENNTLEKKLEDMRNLTTELTTSSENLKSESEKIGTLIKSRSSFNYEIDGPTTEEYVFSILNKADLSYMFPNILMGRDSITYRDTGFYLFYSYISEKDTKEQEKFFDAMIGLVSVERMSNDSKSLIYYLLYKMEQDRGNNFSASDYIKKCESLSNEMYTFLMEQDKHFDLNKLKAQLINQ